MPIEESESSNPKRVVLVCLGLLVLILGAAALVVLNRDRASAALAAQSERAQATLFRLGEVMSIGSALKEEYGLKLDAGYVTSTGSRILRITCTDCDVPPGVTAEAFAHGIAVSAIGKTTKHDRIDTVEVVFRTSAEDGGAEAPHHSFLLEELKRDREALRRRGRRASTARARRSRCGRRRPAAGP